MKNMLTRNPSVTPPHSVRIGSMVALLAAAGAVQTAHAGGVVRAWGDNYFNQCTVPTDLGACTAVAAGAAHSLAVRQDGGVRAWGNNSYGQCTVPTDLGKCTAVSTGGLHSLALTDPLDSNHNGILDSVEIATLTTANTAFTAQLNCGDLNGDGEVNGADLGRMLISWGQCQ